MQSAQFALDALAERNQKKPNSGGIAPTESAPYYGAAGVQNKGGAPSGYVPPPLTDPGVPVPVWGSIGGTGVNMGPLLADNSDRRGFAVQQAANNMARAQFIQEGEQAKARAASYAIQNATEAERVRMQGTADLMRADASQTSAAAELKRADVAAYDSMNRPDPVQEAADKAAIKDHYDQKAEERDAERKALEAKAKDDASKFHAATALAGGQYTDSSVPLDGDGGAIEQAQVALAREGYGYDQVTSPETVKAIRDSILDARKRAAIDAKDADGFRRADEAAQDETLKDIENNDFGLDPTMIVHGGGEEQARQVAEFAAQDVQGVRGDLQIALTGTPEQMDAFHQNLRAIGYQTLKGWLRDNEELSKSANNDFDLQDQVLDGKELALSKDTVNAFDKTKWEELRVDREKNARARAAADKVASETRTVLKQMMEKRRSYLYGIAHKQNDAKNNAILRQLEARTAYDAVTGETPQPDQTQPQGG